MLFLVNFKHAICQTRIDAHIKLKLDLPRLSVYTELISFSRITIAIHKRPVLLSPLISANQFAHDQINISILEMIS